MANTGSFKKSGNDYTGSITTLSLQPKTVRIVPEETRANDNAPKPKPIDRVSAGAAAEVAERAGFTRRSPAKLKSDFRGQGAVEGDKPTEKGGKGRVNITDLLGIEDKYPETQRAQLNLLAPVPVVLRWRQLVADANGRPAWEILERAMEALEVTSRSTKAASRSR